MGFGVFRFNRLLILSLLLSLSFARAWSLELPEHCEFDRECKIPVPGMRCADDTPTFITLVARKEAKNALIFLNGGGACWSQKTCESGYAPRLTSLNIPRDWETGKGIFKNDPITNPFARNYNIINIPYCTGDVYTGNRRINYGTEKKPYVINHHGYNNVVLALQRAKSILRVPEKAVFLGQSAGGIGVYYHLRNFDFFFPESRKYVIADSGTPFRPPHLPQDSYDKLKEVWAVDKTLPQAYGNIPSPKDFGQLIAYNSLVYPHIRFGFIQSYYDYLMNLFAHSLGSGHLFTAVKSTMIDVADNFISALPNARVYFVDHYRHVFTGTALNYTVSLNVPLENWIRAMLDEKGLWQNIRPDQRGPLDYDEQWMEENFLQVSR